MKKIIILLLILFTVFPLYAENLFLTDGSIIKGKVISETSDGILFRDEQKKTTFFPRKRVLRILYTVISMNRIYVQKKDGQNMKVYMVDEDRESYTFRNELYKPEEFTVKREEVLFMAERNPSGLKGEAGTTEIALTWFLPFDTMKYFNIYVKTKKEDSYSLVDKAYKNSYQLKNLSSNTRYFIKVTGVDDAQTETGSSNELEIKTRNLPPYAPDNVRVEKFSNNSIQVTWDCAEDVDGTIAAYKVYSIKGKKKELLGKVKDCYYALSGSSSTDKILITAIDDEEAESSGETRRITQRDTFRVSVSPAVIYPIGDFGNSGGLGYGGIVSVTRYDLFIRGISAGVECGYFYIPGKDVLETEGQKIHRFNFVTPGIKSGYMFHPAKNIYITPAILFGVAYINADYTSRDSATYIDTRKSSTGFDPMAAGSLSFDYTISDSLFAGINTGYGVLFEKKALLKFATGSVTCGVRF